MLHLNHVAKETYTWSSAFGELYRPYSWAGPQPRGERLSQHQNICDNDFSNTYENDAKKA